MQITIKIVLTLVALLGIVWLWRKDIDVARLFSPKRILTELASKPTDFLPERKPTLLYQNGEETGADVVDAIVDEKAKTVHFREIRKSGGLDTGKPFEFQKFVIHFQSADTMIGLDASRPEQGRIIINCMCSIVGRR
jgi:hypothetical protein